jgi:hypothetical protein
MRQGKESLGEEVLLAGLVGCKCGELFPSEAGRKFGPRAGLERFAKGHDDARNGPVAQVVPLGEEVSVFLLDGGFRRFHAGEHGGESFLAVHRGVAGLTALLGVGKAQKKRH